MAERVPVAQVELEFEHEMLRKYNSDLEANGVSKFWNAHHWFFEGYKHFNANEWLEVCNDRNHWILRSIQDSTLEWIQHRIRERGLHIHIGDSFWQTPEGDYLLNEHFYDYYASSPHYDNPEAKWIAKIAMEYFPMEVADAFRDSACPECREAAHF